MTPMIDVVFLLIIFFLISSHLAKQESQLKLPLPIAQSGEQDTLSATPRVTVNVRSDGSITFAGRAILTEEIEGRLAAAKEEIGDDMEVRLRSSRATPYGKVEPVMLACIRTGIWNVKYAVYREDR